MFYTQLRILGRQIVSLLSNSKSMTTMLTLTCGCLNIKLYVKCSEEEFKRQKEQNLTEQDDYIPTGFFPTEVEVTLDTKGITQEHSYLVHRRKHGSYMLFRCLNCGVDSYAMHINGSPIIASGQLQSDHNVIERLYNSADFSKVFQIVLGNKDTQITSAMPDPNSASYESVQSTLNTLQKQLSDFIIQEEAAMENRIREYEETQKEQFQELQVRLKDQKKRMISLLISAAQFDSPNSDEQATRDSSKRSTEARKSPAKKKTVSRMKSLPLTLAQESDDPMFDFDGLGTSDEPFYKDSSTDEEQDDEDVFEERVPRSRPKAKLTYSASVPISVPAWTPSGQRADILNEEQDLTPSEPDQIAASMQALAQSITDDNRYIFGDRPRPRLNTGDYR